MRKMVNRIVSDAAALMALSSVYLFQHYGCGISQGYYQSC